MRLLSFIRAMGYTLAGVFMLLCLPFVVEHVQRNWDAPEYPHTGFCPDSRAWVAPAEEEEAVAPPRVGVASAPQGKKH